MCFVPLQCDELTPKLAATSHDQIRGPEQSRPCFCFHHLLHNK
jgi:hypothetical protein